MIGFQRCKFFFSLFVSDFFFFFEAYLITWQPTPVYLAWKIPWMEERGRLHSMGSQSQTQLSDFSFSLTTFILEIEKELLLW